MNEPYMKNHEDQMTRSTLNRVPTFISESEAEAAENTSLKEPNIFEKGV